MIVKAKGVQMYSGESCRLPMLSFKLENNECAVLTGRSGGGKTTLLRILAGLEKPTEGEVFYSNGEEELAPEQLMKRGDISMLFQENRLLPELSAVENVRIILHGEDKKDTERISRELKILLPDVSPDRPAGLLSGGEQRRVACVRALIRDVPVILLDEPFTGLDEEAVRAVRDYILYRSTGRTVIVTAHEGEHFTEWKRIPVDGE